MSYTRGFSARHPHTILAPNRRVARNRPARNRGGLTGVMRNPARPSRSQPTPAKQNTPAPNRRAGPAGRVGERPEASSTGWHRQGRPDRRVIGCPGCAGQWRRLGLVVVLCWYYDRSSECFERGWRDYQRANYGPGGVRGGLVPGERGKTDRLAIDQQD